MIPFFFKMLGADFCNILSQYSVIIKLDEFPKDFFCKFNSSLNLVQSLGFEQTTPFLIICSFRPVSVSSLP